jgi:hypothetical protein
VVVFFDTIGNYKYSPVKTDEYTHETDESRENSSVN